jgi:hypothetical protein
MALEMARDVDPRPETRRSRRLRVTLAIALMAVLAVQSVVALASTATARTNAFPVDHTPWYQPTAPARPTPGRPAGHTPAGQLAKDKDPRHC